MSFLFWLSLWCLVQFGEISVAASILLNCSVGKENLHLPTGVKAELGQKKHLRGGHFNKTEPDATFPSSLHLEGSHPINAECSCLMDFLECLLKDYNLTGFFVSIFTAGLLGNLIIFFSVLFHFKKNCWTPCVWNLAIGNFSVLIFLCSISLLAFSNYICENSGEAFVKLLLPLAYLFMALQCYNIHFLVSIAVDWLLAFLSPRWYKGHQSNYLSSVLPTILSVLLWPLTCQLLFFFNLEVEHHTILLISLMTFVPLMVISTQTLIMRVWCNLLPQGKVPLEIILGILFSLVTWGPIRLFLTPNHNFAIISLLAFALTSMSSAINPVFYTLIGRGLLPDLRNKRLHFKKEKPPRILSYCAMKEEM